MSHVETLENGIEKALKLKLDLQIIQWMIDQGYTRLDGDTPEDQKRKEAHAHHWRPLVMEYYRQAWEAEGRSQEELQANFLLSTRVQRETQMQSKHAVRTAEVRRDALSVLVEGRHLKDNDERVIAALNAATPPMLHGELV